MARKQQQQQAEEEGRGPRLGPEEQKAAGPRGGGGLKGLLQQQSRAQGGKVRAWEQPESSHVNTIGQSRLGNGSWA